MTTTSEPKYWLKSYERYAKTHIKCPHCWGKQSCIGSVFPNLNLTETYRLWIFPRIIKGLITNDLLVIWFSFQQWHILTVFFFFLDKSIHAINNHHCKLSICSLNKAFHKSSNTDNRATNPNPIRSVVIFGSFSEPTATLVQNSNWLYFYKPLLVLLEKFVNSWHEACGAPPLLKEQPLLLCLCPQHTHSRV